MNSAERRLVKILSDPVLWAQAELNEHPRWYQTEMLRCDSKRIVARIGRRAGKTYTMALQALWYAYTHENSAQLITAPYQEQVKLIFREIRRFIGKSQRVQQSVESDTKNPQYLKLKNGAEIIGLTVGTRSGQGGAGTRGQKADWLYVDEMDYMTDDDFETLYAIVLEDPANIGVFCASTPSGRRGKFWQLCTRKEAGWREFHYSCKVNPTWTQESEDEARGTLSDLAFEHEYLAEFGDESTGVFNKNYIDRSKKDYKYIIEPPLYKAPTIIGVDWDKYGASTQIVVTEYNNIEKSFRIINRVEIERGEYTLDNAVRSLIELNEIYKPDFIYVDRGYGEYQFETLRSYGVEHPGTGLEKKVIGVSFSESLKIPNQFTGEVEKVPIKGFMVDQTSIILEKDLLILSKHDTLVWKQFEDYQVIRTTQTGARVFSSNNEHALDAFMLTILGFTMQFPELANIIKTAKKSTHIVTRSIKWMDKLESHMIARQKGEIDKDEIGLIKVPLGSKPKSINMPLKKPVVIQQRRNGSRSVPSRRSF